MATKWSLINSDWIKARRAVEKYGSRLKGKIVITFKMGEWPGGLARVMRLGKGMKDENIAFFVKGNQLDCNKKPFGSIGVFDYEDVGVTRKKKL